MAELGNTVSSAAELGHVSLSQSCGPAPAPASSPPWQRCRAGARVAGGTKSVGRTAVRSIEGSSSTELQACSGVLAAAQRAPGSRGPPLGGHLAAVHSGHRTLAQPTVARAKQTVDTV